MPANIYVDGFNLYYGAVRNTPYKWLDIKALSLRLLPTLQINRIRYFTARVKALPHDTQKPSRQDIYLRALRTIPDLSIHEGHFVSWPVLMPQYPFAYPNQWSKQPQKVQVHRTDEKGSDVNLATSLLDDCFANDFDQAVVISNDSDLATPISLVTGKYGKNVCVINPHSYHKISRDLLKVATTSVWTINRSVLAACQFPPVLTDGTGAFSKPSTW